MAERYDHFSSAGGPEDDCPYSWISEWLCEYVDGTMDPSMQAVFEEYMEANPELADHVERLCRTRTLLSECQCREEATERAKARLHEARQEEEAVSTEADELQMHGSPFRDALAEETALDPLTVPVSTGTVVAVASAMTLMLGVGMVAGATIFAPPESQEGASTALKEQVDPAPDRPARPSRTAGAFSQRSPSFSSWTSPPLPLKKMPVSTNDSAQTFSAPLLQQAGLNR